MKLDDESKRAILFDIVAMYNANPKDPRIKKRMEFYVACMILEELEKIPATEWFEK